jgi:hypothetical protein
VFGNTGHTPCAAHWSLSLSVSLSLPPPSSPPHPPPSPSLLCSRGFSLPHRRMPRACPPAVPVHGCSARGLNRPRGVESRRIEGRRRCAALWGGARACARGGRSSALVCLCAGDCCPHACGLRPWTWARLERRKSAEGHAAAMTGLADVRRGRQMAQAGVGIFLAPNRTGQFIVTRVTPGGPAQRYACVCGCVGMCVCVCGCVSFWGGDAC